PEAVGAGAVAAGLDELLLIAADAEGPLARPGQDHAGDRLVRPGPLERMDQLLDRPPAEGVHPVLTVDRDGGDRLADLVADIGIVHRDPLLRPAAGRTHCSRCGGPGKGVSPDP